MDKYTQPNQPALYAVPDILARGKFAKSTLYKLQSRGHFPKPAIVLGSRFTRWNATECDLWFSDPAGWIAARSGGAV